MKHPPPPSPEAAAAAFHAAFEAGELEAMMQPWRDAPSVSWVHPGGERHARSTLAF